MIDHLRVPPWVMTTRTAVLHGPMMEIYLVVREPRTHGSPLAGIGLTHAPILTPLILVNALLVVTLMLLLTHEGQLAAMDILISRERIQTLCNLDSNVTRAYGESYRCLGCCGLWSVSPGSLSTRERDEFGYARTLDDLSIH
jgi:hypothetical protein